MDGAVPAEHLVEEIVSGVERPEETTLSYVERCIIDVDDRGGSGGGK